MNTTLLRQEVRNTTPTRPKLLVPIDFTRDCLQALAYAANAAKALSAQVTMLAVLDVNCPTPPTGPVNESRLLASLRNEAAAKLAFLEQTYGRFVSIDSVVQIGRPNKVITEFAAEGGYEAIFMAKHFRGWFHRFCSKHTVERVVEKAPCAVQVLSPAMLRTERNLQPLLAARGLALNQA
ncbi:MAG: Universal stress protein [Verrucomicrobiales bacterium]|nr:Universal stress protein [Verrucomicrobiales bacterium]